MQIKGAEASAKPGAINDRSGSKPERLSTSTCRPVLPQEQTSLLRAGTSASCQKLTFALQQKPLFDHLVGGQSRSALELHVDAAISMELSAR